MNLSIKNKIATLITIPLLAFIILGGMRIQDNWNEYQNSKMTYATSEQFHSVSKIIHFLQLERADLSLLLIGKIENSGLKKNRQNADEFYNKLLNLIQTNDTIGISSNINNSKNELEKLRQLIDSDGLSGETFEKYNSLIASLLEYEISLARKISIAEIQNSLLSITILENSKESLGQLRSSLMPVLLSNSPLSTTKITQIEKLNSNVISQLESHLLEIKPEYKELIKLSMQSENWTLINLIYNAILSKSHEGQYGIDLAGFFDSFSGMITSIEEPMEKVLTESSEIVESHAEKSKNAAITMSAIIALSIVIIFGFVRSFTFKLSESLSLIADSLQTGSSSVSIASEKMADAAESISGASNSQSQSLLETTAAIEEISSMIKNNADNGLKAQEISETTKSEAEKSEKKVDSLINSMESLAESSKKIEEIISVIDDIAFQTNLLALNAAVEAARAGEQGKGFAVVAEAVRSLAQRSSSSAKEISQMIKENVDKTQNGFQIAYESKESLSQIFKSVHLMAELNHQIASASVEQSKGIEDISKAMNNLDQVTIKNNETSESAAKTAEMLSEQAIALNESVIHLSKTIHGKN